MKKLEKVFNVEAGRLITRDGLPFISITREDGTLPVEADEVTKLIARLLNKAVGAKAE